MAPIDATLVGIVIEVRFTDPEKALAPTVVTLDGIEEYSVAKFPMGY
jgi:hypothetical protein